MKDKRIVPTSREVQLDPHEHIVTKTDLTGRITYANRTFMRISNFAENQLLGVQHNIVRHPDMPRGVYHLLWETLKAKREFFGYVKNLTADGDFYWVFANITPDRDLHDKVVGYFSVRRPPAPRAIPVIRSLYRDMSAAERQAGPAQAPQASRAQLERHLATLGQDYDAFVLNLQLG